MTSAMILAMLKTPIKPISLALLILTSSITMALLMFKVTLSSWASFVLIMVFSSGMMTLFIYVSSLAPNEKKSSQLMKPALILLLINPVNLLSIKGMKQQMKTFSNQTLIMIMTTVLILTMMTVSIQSFNPQQSMSSTF